MKDLEFRELYESIPPSPPRCDRRFSAPNGVMQCLNQGDYVVHTFSDLVFYNSCRKCLGNFVAGLVDRGASVNVEKR